MIADGLRRFGALVVALTLLLGPAMHASAMAGMSAQMAVAGATDTVMPDGCDDCGADSDAMSDAACFANCTSPGAILAAAPVLLGAMILAPTAAERSLVIDRLQPPDSDPPRPIVFA